MKTNKKISRTLPKPLTDADKEKQTLFAVLTQPTRELQAQSLGITRQALQNRLVKYKIKDQLEEMNATYVENALTKLHEMLPKAVKGMDKNLESQDERIVLETAKEVFKKTIGDKSTGNTLVQNNIKIVTEQKEKYGL